MNYVFQPLVSIVIPVYNGSNYLKEAIDSALAQTYINCEILVINDGSNDNGKTEEIALSYGNKIRYFAKKNGWVASALNLGISQMKGQYFSWLSHDDQYFPQKIEAQLNMLSELKDRTSIIYTDFNYIDEKSNFLYDYRVKHILPEQFRPAFIWGGLIHGCSLLIPKECFEVCGVFNETLRTTQDYDLWFRFSEKFRFVHLPEILVKSRVHKNQIAVLQSKVMKLEETKLYSKLILKVKHDEIKSYYEKPVAIFYLDYSKAMLRRNLDKTATVAFSLGLINFWRVGTMYYYEFIGKAGSILKSYLRHLYWNINNKR